jgi:hypothetical protein
MDVVWHTIEHRARYGTASDHDVRFHLVVEHLPESEICDWLVWQPDGPLVKRGQQAQMEKAVEAAEDFVKAALRSATPEV